MDERDVAERTEAFLRRQFSIDSADRRFSRTVDLFESGYVDSLGLAELLQFIQDEFEVEIPDEDILSDDFSRIDGIARIVCSRVGT